MLELWGFGSTLWLLLLLGSLWPEVVAPDRFLSMDQIVQLDIQTRDLRYIQLLKIKLFGYLTG